MAEIQYMIEDRYMTRAEAMAFLHVGKEKFAPYERVARKEGKENMYWLHDLVEVQQSLGGAA
ncbi:hypothetical protein [Bifidobacterium aquikefiri]|uniref:hypothetical protein n=1 Tax=Bifidobacterium aquikefiri TaxID=1653207 RepID=UPI0039ED272D